MDWYSVRIEVTNNGSYVLTWKSVHETRPQTKVLDNWDDVIEFLQKNF
jgi:hypothetical protein